ncbi:hypothetical protein IDH44_07085 [Paenibacillus sp. IB182496]|uniref:Uncharacterized protein n=1 Tax=Paenibacillus sabuli TaxID=2772509 RepID=A0A927BQM4_9BACL|nr:hypothetical protein [Paenibacillus sabuli]MBD2844948.1 hypothetical protein [Paenibacillus sabuli]
MKRALSGIMLAAIAAHLSTALYPAAPLQWLTSLLSIMLVALLLRGVKPLVRVLGSVMLAIGLALLAAHDAEWTSYPLSFGRMLNVLSLFALIPLIAIPIELGRYALRVQAMIERRVKYSGLLYSITSLLTFVSSSFMNLAAMPMMYHTMRPSVDLYPIAQKERFLSRSITHGFSLPTLWTPVTPIVGIVVEMTGVKWLHLLPVLIPFSLLCLAVDCLMAHWIAKRRRKQRDTAIAADGGAGRREPSATQAPVSLAAAHRHSAELAAGAAVDPGTLAVEEPTPAKAGSHPLQIVLAVLIFNGMISLLESSAHIGFLLIVTLAVLPYAYVWSLLLGQGRAFLAAARAKLPAHMLQMKDQFFMFLSAGFMISAIEATDGGTAITAALGAVKATVGGDLFLLLVPLIPVALAFLGMQPAVALALTAGALDPHALGVSPELAAIAMLTGAAAGFLVGPYNATANMMAGLIRRSAYKVSNWNLPFTAAYLTMAMVLLLVLKNAG